MNCEQKKQDKKGVALILWSSQDKDNPTNGKRLIRHLIVP